MPRTNPNPAWAKFWPIWVDWSILVDLFPKVSRLEWIQLEKFARLVYGFGRFVHNSTMFGFRAVSGAYYTGDGSFNFAQAEGCVK